MTDFLSDDGRTIFDALKEHCKALKMMSADDYELSMLANAFATYFKNAMFCKEHGETFNMVTKTGDYPMMRPEYNIMKNEYAQILKHSGKFGLNPGDREKLFRGLKGKEKKGFNLTTEMKKAV